MVDAIVSEIDLRSEYLNDKNLNSIYLGGGTPSLLEADDLTKIFDKLNSLYQWDDNTEITLEANPDDLTAEKLSVLSQSPINRLSIGIQSFSEEDLTYMNRAHNAAEAERCIKQAQDVGFNNLSADLIYGSPTTTDEVWEENIEKILHFGVPHISAYALTVEEGTALHHFVASGKAKPVDESTAESHFNILMQKLEEAGYDHYEISNFAKPDKYAIHNSNYWKGAAYLGLGPAAHSYDGISTRSWNLAHNTQYIKQITNKSLPIEHEKLSADDRYNEYILIRLRTIWGIDINDIKAHHSNYDTHLQDNILQYLNSGHVMKKGDILKLTKSGKLIADKISVDLFVNT